jgi:hypothetical protein
MSGPAIAMMLCAMLILWGGLGVAIYNLVYRSVAPEEEFPREL